jgi:alkyl hydroperoxide reductase subunit D
MMSLDTLKAALPDYAKDLRLNLQSVLSSTNLTEQQLWGTAVASAIASRNPLLRDAIVAEARGHLSEAALGAAKAAAVIMGMNNVYYRFTHLVGNADYATMPARLRMQVIGNPGVDRVDFELWSLAVSAVNGCGRCMEAHERTVVGQGLSREAVQDAVRIASVMHGIAVALEAEEITAAEPAIADHRRHQQGARDEGGRP